MSRQYDATRASTLTVPSTVSKVIDADSLNTAVVFVDATVVVPTGTLDVTIYDSPDGTRWFTHTSFTQIVAAGKAVKRITNFGRFLKIEAVVATANVTFQLDTAMDVAS